MKFLSEFINLDLFYYIGNIFTLNPELLSDIIGSLSSIFYILITYNYNKGEKATEEDSGKESSKEEGEKEKESSGEESEKEKENSGEESEKDKDKPQQDYKGKGKATQEQIDEWYGGSGNKDSDDKDSDNEIKEAQKKYDEDFAKKLQAQYYEDQYIENTDNFIYENYGSESSYSVLSTDIDSEDDNERANKKLDVQEREKLLKKRGLDDKEDESSNKRNKK